MTFKKLKTITSHAGHARFLAECEETDLGHIRRQDTIPSPYAYSPVWPVLSWQKRAVIIREVSHRRYVVFEVFNPEYVNDPY